MFVCLSIESEFGWYGCHCDKCAFEGAFVWCAWNYLYDEKLAKKTSIVINEKWITKEELIESADLYHESPYRKHSTYISVKKEDNKQYCCRLVTAYVIVFT